ncbi:MAG: hypothetical protein M0Q43_03955 [Methanothrix sp.]|jgi:ppGpp synthetase/RelA/SpoT-type nucleotidyltranferase|nr:hypothetical protein [Methanothrix sp.]
MDPHECSKRYIEARPKYEMLTIKFKNLIEELLKHEGIKAITEARTKDTESFLGKITRSDKCYIDPLKEITDLSGIRITLFSLSDVEKVVGLINKEFVIDLDRSVNKGDLLDSNQFGYLSQHFIAKANNERKQLPEWNDVSELWAEIQIRTILQHSWATISHEMDYKTEFDVPKELRRRLFRLSALFELADKELDEIIIESKHISDQYKHSLENNEQNIELNVSSLRSYLENSKIIKNYANFIESLNIRIGPIGFISRDVEMAKKININTINDLDELINNSDSWAKDYLREFINNTWQIPLSTKCSLDLNGLITMLLIGNYPDVFTEEVLEKKFGFGRPKRATIPARKINPRFRPIKN